MSEDHDFNQHRAFDNNVNSSLGLYVYALFDPRDRRPFYVGKGGGKHGNDRVLHHFSEARHDRNRGSQSEPARHELSKVRKIQEIWDSGNEVDWKIIRRHLSNEKEALSVEAALIDAFAACGYKLLNAQGGHGGERHGLIEGSRLYEYAAPPIAGRDFPTELINRPLFIFNIGQTVGRMWEGVDRVENPNFKPNYKQATICCWNIGPHWRALSDGVAIGVVGGISRAVFAISDWERCQSDPKLWQIIPADIDENTSAGVLNRDFSSFLHPVKGYLQRGGFVICEVSEAGHRIFRRGAKNRHPDAAPSGYHSA
ncbi:MAG: GIY-YIG nuclease family protein [Natronohydrobacter sp.]|nr:GIY-YIG nuclease family protein [Natronohydrobacter sp.]